MPARTTITQFELANPLYAGAVVSFFTVDGSGHKTAVLATLFDSDTGSGVLANPVTLDGSGKFKQSVYIVDAVIGSVSGISFDDHDTGIIYPNGSDRGNWATATLYYPGDSFVAGAAADNSLDVYFVNLRHISGVFATDLAAGRFIKYIDVSDIAALFSVPASAGNGLKILRANSGGTAYELVPETADVSGYAVSGSAPNSYTASLTPTLAAYVAGQVFYIKFTNGIIGSAPQLNIDGRGNLTIVRQGSSTLQVWSTSNTFNVNVTDIPNGYIAKLLYDGTNLVLLNPFLIGTNQLKNRLKNGGFAVDQRVNSLTTRTDDTYGIDCWNVLTQTAGIGITQQKLQTFDVAPSLFIKPQVYNIRLTQIQAAAQRMGISQIIEARDCEDLQGQQVTFSALFRTSASSPPTIRAAILEWTGTEDAVTSDVVNDWTSGNYTTGNFFISSNVSVTAVGTQGAVIVGKWGSVSVTGTVSANARNLIVLLWTEGTAAQNKTVDFSHAQLEIGSLATDFEYRAFETEFSLCQRYFWKTFDYAIAPAQNTNNNGGLLGYRVTAAGATGMGSLIVRFPVTMLFQPTVTTYNPRAANSKWRNDSTVADSGGGSVTNTGTGGFYVENIQLAGDALSNLITIHASASAEL